MDGNTTRHSDNPWSQSTGMPPASARAQTGNDQLVVVTMASRRRGNVTLRRAGRGSRTRRAEETDERKKSGNGTKKPKRREKSTTATQDNTTTTITRTSPNGEFNAWSHDVSGNVMSDSMHGKLGKSEPTDEKPEDQPSVMGFDCCAKRSVS